MLWILALPWLALSLHPDCWRNTTEIAEVYGYLHETHTVVTKDGYIITIFRIPGKKGEDMSKGPKKVPIVFQPGIAAASDNAVIAGPPYAPGLYFVDRGFDVWVVNARGSTYGKKHIRYSPDDRIFWNFTFEEQALYDQPAYLDYVSKVTGFEKVHYIGHSQGGTQMIAALTLDPGYYSRRLLSFVSLGGPTLLDTARSGLVQVLFYFHYMEISEFFGVYEFGKFSQTAGLAIAFLGTYFPSVGTVLLRLASDDYPEVLNISRASVYMARYPHGTSTKSMKHLLQSMETHTFSRYREKPNDPLVPYDLSKIPAIPIALIGGSGDIMCSPESLLWLHDELDRLGKPHYFHMYPKLGHLGMLAALPETSSYLAEVNDFLKSAETDYPLPVEHSDH